MPNSLKGTGLDQSNLGPNIAGTGPIFRVYAASAVTALSATDAKINFDTKTAGDMSAFDTANAFDLTADRFQPQTAGYYQITGGFEAATGASTLVASIRKNGALYATSTTAGALRAYVSDIVYFNGTSDYIELFGFSSGSQNTKVGANVTYFSGYLARAA